MQSNIGSADRLIRVILGVVIIGLGFYFSSWWGALGLILLATAAINWCPIYAPFKFSTRGAKH
jgi:hypothetical protein